MPGRTPVFFLSHGGPNLMFDPAHEAYRRLQAVGHEITHDIKPTAVVIFSAHFQGEANVIEVNTAETMPLIYDYYGFPPEYYQVQYPNVGSPALAQRIIALLRARGVQAEGVRRGLDHGAFVPFRIAFDLDSNPLGVPIVQVSLFASDDPDQHYRLGEALQELRDDGVLLICAGMSVHNLRDYRSSGLTGNRPYTATFDDALKVAVEQPPADRQRALAELLQRPDARRAHPDFDHLLPVHIAAGAAGSDPGRQIWTKHEGSMAWAQFRFEAAKA